MTITIRPIRPGEGEALNLMVRALAESHGFLDKVKASPEDFERALFASEPIIGCLMAFVDGAPAGCAFWHRSFATSRGQEVMYLEDLSVLPEFRRRGIARALLKELAREAVRRGFASIYWIMMAWNAGARALYEQAGAEIEDGVAYCRLADAALRKLAEEPS